MPSIPRRVVTGHDEHGVSVFASDGPVPVARTAPDGTKIRVNEFPPGVVSPVHRTQSVDYGIVLSGEVVLVLDDIETLPRPGDVARNSAGCCTARWRRKPRRAGGR